MRYHIVCTSLTDNLIAGLQTLDPTVQATGRTGEFTDPFNGTNKCIEVSCKAGLDEKINNLLDNEDEDLEVHEGLFDVIMCLRGPLGAEDLRILKGFSNTPLMEAGMVRALKSINAYNKENDEKTKDPHSHSPNQKTKENQYPKVVKNPTAAHESSWTILESEEMKRNLFTHWQNIDKSYRDYITQYMESLPEGQEKTPPMIWEKAGQEFINNAPEGTKILVEKFLVSWAKPEDLIFNIEDANDGRWIVTLGLKHCPEEHLHLTGLLSKIFPKADNAGRCSVAVLTDDESELLGIMKNRKIDLGDIPKDHIQNALEEKAPVPERTGEKTKNYHDAYAQMPKEGSIRSKDSDQEIGSHKSSILDKINKNEKDYNKETIRRCLQENLF